MRIDAIEENGKTIIHATATQNTGMPKVGVMVGFKVGGKSVGRPCSTDASGISSIELTLKPGRYAVEAEIIGGGDSTLETIVVTGKQEKTHWLAWVGTVILLILVLEFGYTALTILGLILAVGMLVVGSNLQNKDFGKMLGNNNWVFYTLLWLTIFSFVFFLFSLHDVELNPLTAAWEATKNMVAPPPTDPWANDGFGPWLYRLFLGEGGWGKAASSFAFWTLLAIPITFWDDVVSWRAKRKTQNTNNNRNLLANFAGFFLEDGIAGWLWKRLTGK